MARGVAMVRGREGSHGKGKGGEPWQGEGRVAMARGGEGSHGKGGSHLGEVDQNAPLWQPGAGVWSFVCCHSWCSHSFRL